jgi:hypothetical protein
MVGDPNLAGIELDPAPERCAQVGCRRPTMCTEMGFPILVRCATRPSIGIISLRSSSRFEYKSVERLLSPVILPPGWAMLLTNVNGSPVAVMTIGIVSLACLAANAAGVPRVKIRSQFKRTSSLASSGKRSERPSAERYSMTRFRPSICPSSRNACRNASKFAAFKGRDVISSTPIRGPAPAAARAPRVATPPRRRRA